MPTIDAACKIARDQQIPLLISGGIGHSTTFCIAPSHSIRTTTLSAPLAGRSDHPADIAHQFWHIPHEKSGLKTSQQSCGENARFSIALLNQAVERVFIRLSLFRTPPCSGARWRRSAV